MAKNRNQNRDRGGAPARRGDGAAAQEPGQGATMEAPVPVGSQNSGMNQEMSRKRKKKFGHN